MKMKLNSNGEVFRKADSELFENIQQINRDLLVAAGAELPGPAALALDQARSLALFALNTMRPEYFRSSRRAEELPISEFKALSIKRQKEFAAALNLLEELATYELRSMPSKLNGRRRARCHGCL
jgi:hypothetical protein